MSAWVAAAQLLPKVNGEEMKEIHGFLLVTVDPPRINGGSYPAWGLVRMRLEKRLWPIYANTRNRRRLEAGKHVAFYVGGKEEHCGEIVATAVIRSVETWTRAKGSIDPDHYLTDFAEQALCLTDVVYLSSPILLKDRVKRVSFAPTNMMRWGVVLMGGCRALTRKDWDVLIVP